MRRGRHVTIYLDDAITKEIDRHVRKPERWLMYSPCWRSRSSFIADACAQMLRTIVSSATNRIRPTSKPTKRRRA